MINSKILSIGHQVKYNGNIVKIAQLQEDNATIAYPDGTKLLVKYNDLSGIVAGSNVLLQIGCKHISTNKYPLHQKEMYIIDVLGKKYLIHVLTHDDSGIICRFDFFISFHYFHELQSIVGLVNPEMNLEL